MTELTKMAKAFAYERHAGQLRKGNGAPFTDHLDKVVSIVKTLTRDEEVIAAAWLHDVVEDTDTKLSEVLSKFGPRVGHLVDLESEDKRPHLSETTSWKARKVEQIEELLNTPPEDADVFMIALSDKLANVTDMVQAHKELGDDLWLQFNNKDPKEQYWYYKTFADIIGEKSNLSGTLPYMQYLQAIEELWA